MTSQRTAVITGSTGGIGQEIARILARQGWSLILVNRSREKADSQMESLHKERAGMTLRSHIANMLDANEIREVARQISSEHAELGALYNVAGLLTDRPTASPRNVEGHFAVNTLAPILLTTGLQSRLAAGAVSDRPSVVVNFTSSAINRVRELDFDRLMDPASTGGLMGAYAQSKMALTIATSIMATELGDQGILPLAVDPGATKTPMTNSGDGMPRLLRLLAPLLFKSPSVQAERIVQAVESAVGDNESSFLIVEGRRKPMPAIVSDRVVRERLASILEACCRE